MKHLMLFLSFTTLIGCSGSGDAISPIINLFIPNLSNQWVSNRDTVFFFIADKKASKSTFTGSEQSEDGIADLIGSYDEYDIEFFFVENPDIKYIGKFIKGSDPLVMELKSQLGDELKITQNK